MTTSIERLLASNSAYASSDHTAPPTFAELGEMLKHAAENASRVCIITCADPRLDPAKFFMLSSHPEITPIIIRNAGGSAKKALPDVLAVDSLVSFTDILVIRHLDCGTTLFRDGLLKEMLHERVRDCGSTCSNGSIDELDFGECIVSAEEKCREEVEWLRGLVLVRAELRANIKGGVLDLQSGTVKLVV